jgi:transcriptional regulator with XRE-family HTH domain
MASRVAGRAAPANLVAKMATFDDQVRARLRQLRFERGLSLSALAAASGLAASTISRLETGERRLTLAHVATLARALDVATDDLLATGDERGSPGRDGKTWEAVGPERTAGARVYRVGIPAELREPALHGHEGHQWLYVMEGRVRLIVGDDDRVVEQGQAAQFHTWLPHWLGAADGPAEVVIIHSPDGRMIDQIRVGAP